MSPTRCTMMVNPAVRTGNFLLTTGCKGLSWGTMANTIMGRISCRNSRGDLGGSDGGRKEAYRTNRLMGIRRAGRHLHRDVRGHLDLSELAAWAGLLDYQI